MGKSLPAATCRPFPNNRRTAMRQTTELFLSLAFWLDIVPFCVGLAYAAIRAVIREAR